MDGTHVRWLGCPKYFTNYWKEKETYPSQEFVKDFGQPNHLIWVPAVEPHAPGPPWYVKAHHRREKVMPRKYIKSSNIFSFSKFLFSFITILVIFFILFSVLLFVLFKSTISVVIEFIIFRSNAQKN